MEIELEKTYLLKYLPEDLKEKTSMEIFDIYIPKSADHSILRIRKRGDICEITKKEPIDGKDSSEQSEHTIKLSEEEFSAFKNIDGKKLHKIRYFYPYGENTAEIDVYQDDFEGLGFKVEELDLREYFGKEKELEELLKQKDLVWINGGNTFLLRRAMKQSGFDNAIKNLLAEDKIVYAGFSAACAVLHKDLHGIELSDDPNIVVDGYNKEIVWDGLGLIDFNIVVHYDSDHPESEFANEEIIYYKKNNIPYKPLRDGELIIINGDNLEIIK